MQNVGETHDRAIDVDRAGEENFIAGQTLPDADALVAPPGPVTLSVRLYFCAVAPASAGNVTGTDT